MRPNPWYDKLVLNIYWKCLCKLSHTINIFGRSCLARFFSLSSEYIYFDIVRRICNAIRFKWQSIHNYLWLDIKRWGSALVRSAKEATDGIDILLWWVFLPMCLKRKQISSAHEVVVIQIISSRANIFNARHVYVELFLSITVWHFYMFKIQIQIHLNFT